MRQYFVAIFSALSLSSLLWLSPCCVKDFEVRAQVLGKEIDKAFAQQKWEIGEKKAQEILAMSGLPAQLHDQAKLKLDQARSEQQAKLQYARFSSHLMSDPDVAVAAYRDMPESSYYRQLARPDYEKLRLVYVAAHLEKAVAAERSSRCADIKTQVQMVLDVDPQNQKAMDLGKKPCSAKD